MDFCLTGARYSMKCVLMDQSTIRNPDTLQTERTWAEQSSEIDCQARGILGGGIRVVGSTERFSNMNYEDVDWVKMQTTTRLSKRQRVTKIRTTGSSTYAWENDDGSPIVFEVMGSTPVVGPFGNIVEYDNLLFRVQDATDF